MRRTIAVNQKSVSRTEFLDAAEAVVERISKEKKIPAHKKAGLLTLIKREREQKRLPNQEYDPRTIGLPVSIRKTVAKLFDKYGLELIEYWWTDNHRHTLLAVNADDELFWWVNYDERINRVTLTQSVDIYNREKRHCIEGTHDARNLNAWFARIFKKLRRADALEAKLNRGVKPLKGERKGKL